MNCSLQPHERRVIATLPLPRCCLSSDNVSGLTRRNSHESVARKFGIRPHEKLYRDTNGNYFRCSNDFARRGLSCVGWIRKKPWYELAQPVQRFHVDKTQDANCLHFSPHERVAAVKRHLLVRVPISAICEERKVAPNMFY